MVVKIVCENCSKDFYVKPCHVGVRKFCSRRCMGKWYSINRIGEKSANWHGGNVIKCFLCGKSFKTNPYLKGIAKFCSKKCYGKWFSINKRGKNNSHYQDIMKNCIVCNKGYRVIKSRENTAKFCSRECKKKHYTGKNHYNWQGGYTGHIQKKLRDRLLKRDSHQCILCWNKNELNIHHIYPKGKYPELFYYMDNIVTLCYDCHMYFDKCEESFIDFFERIKGCDINEEK